MAPINRLFMMGYGAVAGGSGATSGSRDAARAKSKIQQVERNAKMLEENLAKTMLICEALWELLSEKTGLTINDLHEKLYDIDMRDGTLDGKNQRSAVACGDCGRMVGPRHSACLYCGHVIDDSVFRL